MRYTLIFLDKKVVFTDYYDFENDWNSDYHYLIINNVSNQYTTNGYSWIDIEDDHL